MAVLQGQELALDWAHRLGLATTPLLDVMRDPGHNHFALLDGVEGSFAVSTAEIDRERALDWTWSSQLGVHVQVELDAVFAHQVAERTSPLRFKRTQVETNIEAFLQALETRRVDPASTIVDHVVGCFRSHRVAATAAGLDPVKGLTSFLDIMDRVIAGEPCASGWPLPGDHEERVREELRYNRITRRHADLGLTMRHASGLVFQETHAAISAQPVEPQLFGLAPAPRRSTRNRLGAYYTPPGLARVLCDLAVAPHLGRKELRIVDPSCGSGIFLCEVLRSLQRQRYAGRLELVGFDVSEAAIEMARFALRHSDAVSQAEVRLETRDFLEFQGNLAADIVLMNPPFVAAQDLEPVVVARARKILGPAFQNRPDLSMVFTTLALWHLREGGTLATLLPAGVLSQQFGKAWRSSIVEASDLDLLAVLGDHGLFRDAMVNISALMLRKNTQPGQQSPAMLWASQRRGASGRALRRLRRWQDGDRNAERTSDWSIYLAKRDVVIERDDWTPRPYSLGDLPEKLRATAGITTVEKLFHVELGIRAGTLKDILQLKTSDYESLPARERALFRPVADTKSIRNGRILPTSYLFYPDQPMTPPEIARLAPKFHTRLIPADLPQDRPVEVERARRDTNMSRNPRIVSRAFLSTESFAVDLKNSHVVVQGYSWLPRLPVSNAPFGLADLLSDYCFLLNSRVFFMLSRELGRIVGGGQVDGAKNQMRHIPLPDLARQYLEDTELKARADDLRKLDSSEYPRMRELDAFASHAYRTRLSDWSLPE